MQRAAELHRDLLRFKALLDDPERLGELRESLHYADRKFQELAPELHREFEEIALLVTVLEFQAQERAQRRRAAKDPPETGNGRT